MEWIDVKHTNIDRVRYPCHVTVKLDGELVAWNGKELVNSYGNGKDNVDVRSFPSNCVLMGEMYYRKGQDFYVYQKRRNDVVPNELKVAFFDVMEYGGSKVYGVMQYKERWDLLTEIVPSDLLIPVPTMSYNDNKSDILNGFKQLVNDGYEGVVIKPLDSLTCESWVKLKRTYHDILYVRGIRKGSKNAISIGDKDRLYCSVSTIGWLERLQDELAELKCTGEDKENWLLPPVVKVKVEHNGYIQGKREREIALRHPRLKDIGVLGNLTLPR